MLIDRYLQSNKNLPGVLRKIQEGAPPQRFTVEHLKSLGFTSSNDTTIVRLLKDLGFLSENGEPTDIYHAYRDSSKSEKVLGRVLLDKYGDLFHINENLSESHRKAVEGKFKATLGLSDDLAGRAASTFFTLLKISDIAGARSDGKVLSTIDEMRPDSKSSKQMDNDTNDEEQRLNDRSQKNPVNLRYNIEIHLPASPDITVYNAIFKALKEHLL